MKRVLVIDDDPDVRIVMDRLMKKQGYAVDTASSKEEALEKLYSFGPEIVLLDVLLSGSDGRKLCSQIKSTEKLKDIRVIMISAHPGAADNFDSYGADDFISKPVNTEVLLNKIQQLVNAE